MEMPFFSSLSLSYHYIVIYIVDDKTKSDDDSMEVESWLMVGGQTGLVSE